jgi:hypothetical protein
MNLAKDKKKLLRVVLQDKRERNIPALRDIALDWSIEGRFRANAINTIAQIDGENAINALRDIARKTDHPGIKVAADKLAKKLEANQLVNFVPLAEGQMA